MNWGKKILLILVIFSVVIFLMVVFAKNFISKVFFSPTNSNIPEGITLESLSVTPESEGTSSDLQKKDVEVIASKLEIPWDLAYLPDGDLMVTERNGKVLRIGKETKTITTISGVVHSGEGGLLGIALHPNFSANKFVYLYSTTRKSGGGLQNRVERYTLEGDSLTSRVTILDNLNGSANHDGGRIEFGPDGFLYITVGDAEVSADAQKKESLNGKILRITDSGDPAPGNPFNTKVYSYGHRNPQGLAWDQENRLWSTEHGPSGTRSGNDELNTIVIGGNYGWPNFVGQQKGEGIITPFLESGSDDTWAPASLLYYKENLFFGGLRGEALYQVNIKEGANPALISHFKNEFGRIRTIRLFADGYFYMTTSNRDGRGEATEDDDKIIRINPEIFFKQ